MTLVSSRVVNLTLHCEGQRRHTEPAAGAPAVRDVLQRALAALVAHRAVERMVHQQELDDGVLRLLHAIGGGDHHHALLVRRGAARLELGHALDLHEAHAAGTNRLSELGLVTEVGDLHVALLGGVHEHHALGRLHLAAVDLEGDELRFRSSHYAAWSAGGAPTPISMLSRSAASRARSMCCSNSPRNFLIIEPTGIAIESPSTQRQFPMMLV